MGTFEQVEHNRYCSYCNKYGHIDMIDGCELWDKHYRSEMRKDQVAQRKP